jgi:hypothetical protein
MNTSKVQIQVNKRIEKIAKGYLVTEVSDTGKISKWPVKSIEKILEKLLSDKVLLEALEQSLENESMDLSIVLSKTVSPHGEIHRRKQEMKTIEQLKSEGIIEPAKTFDPKEIKQQVLLPIDNEGNILPEKITAENAYSVKRLKSINFTKLFTETKFKDKELAEVAGIEVVQTFSSLKRNIRLGTTSFSRTTTRISCTKLAKFFEEQSKNKE